MMPLTAAHVVLAVGAGVLTGVLSAAFGVGGAVISTPAIRALGVTAIFAIGTTLPSILPGAATGTARYAGERLIDARAVRWTAPSGILAAVAGSALSHVVPGNGHLLMILTAGLIGSTAIRMARTRGRGATDQPEVLAEYEPETDAVAAPRAHQVAPGGWVVPSPPILVLIGAAAGLLSGLLGIGGGVIMVPAFTELARIPLKTAIATSLACVGLFAVPGTLAHWRLGDIDWATAGLLSLGVVPGARLGARLAITARDARLRLVVAAFLGAAAVLYAGGEIMSLVR